MLHLEEDGDAEVHEGHGEVDALLALIGDGKVGNGQVRFLQDIGKCAIKVQYILELQDIGSAGYLFEKFNSRDGFLSASNF